MTVSVVIIVRISKVAKNIARNSSPTPQIQCSSAINHDTSNLMSRLQNRRLAANYRSADGKSLTVVTLTHNVRGTFRPRRAVILYTGT